MSKAQVIYRLEYRPIAQLRVRNDWTPARNAQQEPVTYRGRGAKSKAINGALTLTRVPAFDGLRVMRGSQPVWTWTREKGVSK